MSTTETEVELSIENKVSEKRKFIETYFKKAEEKKYRVTFLLIVDKTKTANMLDKIFTRSQEALSEICPIRPPSNESKNEFTIINEIGSLYIRVSCDESDFKKESIWEVCIEGQFELLEEYRIKFLVGIKDYCLMKYCIVDEISNEISVTAYPIIRNMENTLREYLVRFFAKKFGSKWWENNTTSALKAKVADRKRGSFSNLLNMELYNIDFNELTILLNGQFGQTDSKAILDALDVVENHRENQITFEEKIQQLRNRFLGNWEKFFGQEIRIDNFLNDWNEMYEVRCEVAHNSLLTLKRFIKLVDLHNKLEKNLEKLINEQRIIKSSEYLLLDEITKLKIKLTKRDVEGIIKDSFLFISSINFGSEMMPLDLFKVEIESLKESLNIFGDFTLSAIQLSDLNADDDRINGRPSVNAKFSEVPIDVIGALKLGLTNNLFTNNY